MCGPVRGCETVTTSEYSTLAGVPIAALGFGLSLILVGCAVRWWRWSDRQALLVAWMLLLLGTLTVASLSYLEVFVIHAICAWCVGYATTILLSLVVTGLALRRG